MQAQCRRDTGDVDVLGVELTREGKGGREDGNVLSLAQRAAVALLIVDYHATMKRVKEEQRTYVEYVDALFYCTQEKLLEMVLEQSPVCLLKRDSLSLIKILAHWEHAQYSNHDFLLAQAERSRDAVRALGSQYR